MNAFFLLLTISLMVLLTTADDTPQQPENSVIKAKPEVSQFVRQLVHSVRKRSLGFDADEVFTGLAERGLWRNGEARRYREEEEARRHRAALRRQEQEELSEEEAREEQALRDQDDSVENRYDELEERVNQHNEAHAALKRIHTALKQADPVQAKAQNAPQMHKRGNSCNIAGNQNSQWCHNG